MQRWDKKSELGFEFEKALIELEKDNIANVEDNGEKRLNDSFEHVCRLVKFYIWLYITRTEFW